MAGQASTELQTFVRFLDEQIQSGRDGLSPEEGLAEFRAWQEDVRRLREELRPALERAARGEGREIDFDALIQRGREQLIRAGIPE